MCMMSNGLTILHIAHCAKIYLKGEKYDKKG